MLDIAPDFVPLPLVNACWQDEPIVGGGYGEVRKGTMGGRMYALKTPRAEFNLQKSIQSEKVSSRRL